MLVENDYDQQQRRPAVGGEQLTSHDGRGRYTFRPLLALIVFIPIGFIDNLFGNDFFNDI